MQEEPIGKVIKFFAKPSVAAVEITGEELKVGDLIHFKGHTTDFQEEITSMQIENKPVDRATKGDLVGIKVRERVRPNDLVYKLSE